MDNMTFSNKLRALRKQAGLSQEQLAEKLSVSRQAVTKWETDAGVPDIVNIKAISNLFDISIDRLLSNERSTENTEDPLFKSITEYDIDEIKNYDINLGAAKQLIVSGYDGEKLRICLSSNTLSTLQNDFKVKIDDMRKRIDIDLHRKNGVSDATAKKALSVFVQLPAQYIGKIECSVTAERVELRSLKCDDAEFDAKTSSFLLSDFRGTLEINNDLDMEVVCRSLNGELSINQISATSRLLLPEGTVFTAVAKGIRTSISYEKNGAPTDDLSTPESENIIELNGMKSELVICTL